MSQSSSRNFPSNAINSLGRIEKESISLKVSSLAKEASDAFQTLVRRERPTT